MPHYAATGEFDSGSNFSQAYPVTFAVDNFSNTVPSSKKLLLLKQTGVLLVKVLCLYGISLKKK